jgi:16S rRNA (adenine1518-N6/adenine1519-N6)-dimethyltransferase
LLISWLTLPDWPPWWDSLTLMFQREVAERIVADERRPKDYGRLSILCGWRTEASILFDVPGSAFVPPPKVTSSVVRLVPRCDIAPASIRSVETVAQAAFGQRRKMLRQSLRSLVPDPLPLLEAAGILPTARAEEIPVSGFIALARAYEARPR